MKTLVIAEHDKGVLKPETNKTVTAAVKLGFDVDLLLAGENLSAMPRRASRCVGLCRIDRLSALDRMPTLYRLKRVPPRFL